MNILLSSAGRRGYLVEYFKEALNGSGKVFVTNSTKWCTSFIHADEAEESPLIYDENYIPFMLDYCKKNSIELIIPLVDIDLPVLASNKDKFKEIGTDILVSDLSVIELCNDKWKTYQFLKENGFYVPKTYLSLQEALDALLNGEINYPIIVKPRFGCGSIAMSIAEDETALLYYYSRNMRAVKRSYLKYESEKVSENILFQQMLDGQEYGVDIINDLEGNFQNSIIKKKFAMRAGETDIAELVKNEVIFNETKKLAQKLKHIANMDCDVFMVDGKPYILEMNARFGGGYPFSHMAGCNLPKAIINWKNGKKVERECLTSKTGMTIFKDLTLVGTDLIFKENNYE